jgi:hypothetical protein
MKKVDLITVFLLVLFAIVGCEKLNSDSRFPASEKPRYIGVYIEKNNKLLPIGWKTKADRALVIENNTFSVITYGINLNLGGGDILNPSEVVGIEKEGSESYFLLSIEAIDMKENYFRYQLPDPSQLQEGLYSFFITSRIWGKRDKYYFRIKGE